MISGRRFRGAAVISAILLGIATLLVTGCGAASSAPRWYTERTRLPSCGALDGEATPLTSAVGRSAVRCLFAAQIAGRQAELDVRDQPDVDGTIDVALRVVDREHVVVMRRFYHYRHGGNRWSITDCATLQSPIPETTYANLGDGCGPEQVA